ncbi:MAG TPA: cation:proton antiporter [Gemmatimonadaceae bacterium]|nr:cation:proton antiporter [Gemmatimonadaceae bacterium]
MRPGPLADLTVLFALSVVVVVAFHRLRLPPIVGFLFTGVLAGPYGFGLIRNVADVRALADVGVILLLFTIGLEFSLHQLVRLRAFLFAGGALQVGITLAAMTVVGIAFGLSWRVAAFVGMLVALSSTAIVLRLLADRGEIDSPHGQAALGILIFQDLCVVPMVLLTPMLGGHGGGAAALGRQLLVAALFLAGALAASRLLVPRLLHLVVGTRRREVFVLTIVLLCLGAAWASAAVGLSLALGAFIAGLIVSSSEYSHQALGEVLPLREVFNSIFFISIGMLFDVRTVAASPLVVAAAIAGVVVAKAIVTTGVTFALGQSLRIALVTGLALAQIGEFSFVLSKVGSDAGLLSVRLDQLFLAVAVGTMALTPGLLALAPRLATRAERRVPGRWVARRYGLDLAGGAAPVLADHVIIVGFGFNGRNLARVLRRVGIPYTVIEMNPEVVHAERPRGVPVIYGDATRPEVLRHAGIERARVMVIAISDAAATRSTVAAARRLAPHLHIVVRTRYIQETRPLLALGTEEVVPEEFETAIEIFSRVLRRYRVPADVVEREVVELRRGDHEMPRSMPEPSSRRATP